MTDRIAVFGGVYSNYHALEAVLADARQQGVRQTHCLGDVGGFGPHPDRAADRLRRSNVHCLQGNYDDSVGNGRSDCQCGYTDPRDNHFAELSYRYTLQNTSEENRAWMRGLSPHHRMRLGDRRVLMAHGSPRQVNEFLWESMTPPAFVRRLLEEFSCDLILVAHSGLYWSLCVDPAAGRGLINVGAIGRPANDGDRSASYAIVSAAGGNDGLGVEFRRVEYDWKTLAAEMRSEGLPEEFTQTIETGWWTTCLEILPAKERGRGRF
ncbi:MAG TPA: metallophosphoesterase family protein [Candidatus Krumholzibacteria bacterium]